SWQHVGSAMPNVQVRDLDLNLTTNALTAATYGRGVYQIFLTDGLANAGAVRALSGTSVWTGPILLAGDTALAANGSQSLQNGLAAASLTVVGVISDLTAGGNYQ